MTKRFYVSMTWEDWPACGSYGTFVEAPDHEAAQRLCMIEMANCEDGGGGILEGVAEEDYDAILDQQDWHLVDCFDVDNFIKQNQKPPTPKEIP